MILREQFTCLSFCSYHLILSELQSFKSNMPKIHKYWYHLTGSLCLEWRTPSKLNFAAAAMRRVDQSRHIIGEIRSIARYSSFLWKRKREKETCRLSCAGMRDVYATENQFPVGDENTLAGLARLSQKIYVSVTRCRILHANSQNFRCVLFRRSYI